jgi:hypothetical protein
MFFYKEVVNNNNNPLSLNLDLSNIVFSDTLINGEATGSVTISATGTGTETITITDNSGQFSASPASFNLVGGSSQIVSLIFSPTSTGNKTGTVTISASGGNSAQLTLSGSGSQFVETQILFASETPSNNVVRNANALCVSDNGENLFVASQSGQVHIYNIISGSFLVEEMIENDPILINIGIYSSGLVCNSSGNIFAYGSPEEEKIKIYEKISNSWTLRQTITRTGPGNADGSFALALSMNHDGNILAVASPADETASSPQDEGLIYIYEKNINTWTLQDTISLSQYGSGYTGTPLKLNRAGNRLFIAGQTGANDLAEIFILDKISGSWTYSDKISIPNSFKNQYPTRLAIGFTSYEGLSVNYEGNYLAASFEINTPDGYVSKVCCFNSGSSGWLLEQIISPISDPDRAEFDSYFGYSIKISENLDKLFIAQPISDIHTINSKAVYVYARSSNQWTFSHFLTASNYDDANFGIVLTANNSGSIVVVGDSVAYNPSTEYQGAAYVFKKQ